MRGGICTIPQALTTEAAGVVKQALHLARRRNHSQVTPLHVAISLLESSSSLLRKACLRSNSHPLQCRALELCFNVSLNRLPTSTLSCPPFLTSSHSTSPSLSLSNALVAAFKRAQAHQRRGSIESQQQPILALKIEIEQLVISILDDPSVSRVMREAGFSSTQVKSNVEQTTSFDFFPQSCPSLSSGTSLSNKSIISPFIDHLRPTTINQAREKDVAFVLNALMKDQKRNNVIVGECLASAESVVGGVMDKIKRGHVDEKLKFMQFINLPLLSFKNVQKEEVEQKLFDLKYIIRTYIRKGLVLYLGDLKWVSDLWSNCCEQNRSYYFPIQHMIMEIRRLVCTDFGGDNKLCIMGIANFQSYLKCKAGHPSLESIWNLRALSIPVESLGLSLKVDSDWKMQTKGMALLDLLSARSRESVLPKNATISLISNLPPWLQCYKLEKRMQTTNNQGFEYDPIMSVLEKNELKPDLQSNPNSSPNSATSSEAGEGTEEDLPMFKEFNTENVSILCSSLEKKVPWQKEIILEIVSTVLQCRSGMMKKREKEETWLFFLGVEITGKLKIAQELARLVFSSWNNFIKINSCTSFTLTRSDSTDELSNKRKRDELGGNYMKLFTEAVHENPHRVFFLEDFEQLDYNSQMGIKRAIENGTLTLENGEFVHFEDAIIIFSCESLSSVSRTCSPPQPVKCKLKEIFDEGEDEDESGKGQVVEFDLNTVVGDDEHSVLNVGIKDVVDKQIMFKTHDFDCK